MIHNILLYRNIHRLCTMVVGYCLVISSGVLSHSAVAVDYLRDIKPLLTNHCYACHGALKQESSLRLDTVQSMLSGGDNGPAIVASASDKSELLQRIASSDPLLRMPPEGRGLTSEEIKLIEQWIAQGASHPADEQPQADPLSHWAFRTPRRPPLPEKIEGSPSSPGENATDNPIDRFLDASARRLDVQPLPAASRSELLRRVTIDLNGLPPTREELHAFLGDESSTAYESMVDRLLQRPEYGQRWGRHWMDVWRYSDWYGRRAVPDVMNSYPQIWRWRDWIVRSLNEDKGYDRMVMEMLAADELVAEDDENVVATGFIVRNWYKWNYETWMKDSVEHTGKAFLGLTLNCAMCHDHKFDPITQEDYFRFRAFFEPLELRHERVAGEPDPGPFQKYVYAKSYGPIKSGAIRVFDEKLDAQTFMFRGGDARNRIEGKPPVDARPPAAFTSNQWRVEQVRLPPEASYPGLKPFIREEELNKANAALETARAAESDQQLKLVQADESLAQLTLQSTQPDLASARPAAGQLIAAQRAATDARMVHRSAVALRQSAEAVLRALKQRIAADDATSHGLGDAAALAEAAYMAECQAGFLQAEHACSVAEQTLVQAERSAAEATLANVAANVAAANKAVEAAAKQLASTRTTADAARTKLAKVDRGYTPLSPKYPQISTGRRTALVRWMVSPDNPFTARVAVNHIWLRHFGQPLVESVDNFGIQGKSPTHPELLDWLAVELMDKQWSMKTIHRLIVTSAAYRRSSRTQTAEHPNLAKDRDNVSYWRYPTRRMEAEVVRDSVLACAGALDRSPGGPELDVADWITKPRRSLYFTQHGESQMLFLSTFDGANVCDCYRRTSTVLPNQALALSNSELLVHYGRVAANRLSTVENASEPAAFVLASFETLLGRAPDAQELALSLQFLADQTRATKDAASATRARENFMIALFNHNDFVAVR